MAAPHGLRYWAALVLFASTSIVTLAAGARAEGYTRELLAHLGSGMALLTATYAIFNPMIAERQTANVVDHARLDLHLFTRLVAASRSEVAVLETWTGLLEPRYASQFLNAARQAIQAQVLIRILLLDPGSLAAKQRTAELGGQRDVGAEIMDNLRRLDQFARGLDGDLRSRFQVRIYSSAYSIQMYRWDDKAFVAYYPGKVLAYDSVQEEIYMQSPFGRLIEEQFERVWGAQETRSLEQYMLLHLDVAEPSRPIERCMVEYVDMDNSMIISMRGLNRYLGDRLRTLTVKVEGAPDHTPYRLLLAPDDVQPRIRDLFLRKYGVERDTFAILSEPVAV